MKTIESLSALALSLWNQGHRLVYINPAKKKAGAKPLDASKPVYAQWRQHNPGLSNGEAHAVVTMINAWSLEGVEPGTTVTL